MGRKNKKICYLNAWQKAESQQASHLDDGSVRRWQRTDSTELTLFIYTIDIIREHGNFFNMYFNMHMKPNIIKMDLKCVFNNKSQTI